MEPAVYLVVGFPGTGKYTVGKELVAQLGEKARLVDNHHINNVVFGVLPVDGVTPLPDAVWDLVTDVRRAVLTAAEKLAPADFSFVFTNFIHAAEADDPPVVAYVSRLERIARARGTHLRLVRLTCEREELLRRVVRPDRATRLKATSAEWVAEVFDAHEIYEPAGVATLTLDVTKLDPATAASVVLSHAW